jgi:formylglycine-generating enzyme required for sulfatase activity
MAENHEKKAESLNTTGKKQGDRSGEKKGLSGNKTSTGKWSMVAAILLCVGVLVFFLIKNKNRLNLEFVHIPPGTFTMGSPSGEWGRDNDEQQHQVTLTKGFYMQTTEVTQRQWRVVMGKNPSHFGTCAECPVERVSWTDVQEFIKKLNQKEGNKYRLPTEAEWEYACRAGTKTPFSLGEIIGTDQANYDGKYIYGKGRKGEYREKTVRVKSFVPNAWGLYDMHGNVWEWCSDWKGSYPSGSETDPSGSEGGSDRVVRGGSWLLFPGYLRSANRDFRKPGSRFNDLGFRLCKNE